MAASVEGEVLARKIEILLPPLDLAIGRLLGARPRTRESDWLGSACRLRTAYVALAPAVERLEKKPLPVVDFAALWPVLDGLASMRNRNTIAPLAKKARAAFEPVWREVVRSAACPPRGGDGVVREKEAVDILCARCRKPALRFARDSRYTRVGLGQDGVLFLKPYLERGSRSSWSRTSRSTCPTGSPNDVRSARRSTAGNARPWSTGNTPTATRNP